MKERIIFHCDLDCFYASVEIAENPKLKGKSIAVCGDIKKRHGIILAKSYEAKKYGIKTGMPLFEARKLCPDIIFIEAHFSQYQYYAELVRNIYLQYSDLVESFGLDENWIDMTSSLHLFAKTPYEMATIIQEEILNATGLTVSIGIGWNKIIAKFGSDYNKPFGITEITRENMKDIFWNSPVEDLLYVGIATKQKFNKWGIETIEDLAMDLNGLIERHGNKIDKMLVHWANGYDSTPVSCEYTEKCQVKSVGNSITTTKDMMTREDILIVVQTLSEAVATRLRMNGLIGMVISINFRDNTLESKGAQHKLNRGTDVSKVIIKEAMRLIDEHHDYKYPLRSVGVSVSNLTSKSNYVQEDIFGVAADNEEERTIDMTIDKIRDKYGYNKICRCSKLIDVELTNFNPLEHTIHPIGYLKNK